MTPLLSPNQEIYEQAQQGKRVTHPVLTPWVVLGVVFISQIGAAFLLIPLLIFLGASLEDLARFNLDFGRLLPLPQAAIAQFALLTLAFGPVFFLLWLWVRLFEGRPLKSLALTDGRAMWHYLRGFVVGGVIFSAAVGLMALLGFVENTPRPEAVSLGVLGGSVALVLVGWVVQGAAEEFIFRGWLLPVLAVRLKPWLAILLSSIGFAFIHSLNPNLSPLAVVNLFLFGVFAALYTIYEGSIWGIFSIHTVWNWLQGNVFGFQVSGSSSVGGSLLNLRETGPDIITGGSFGPEGGLAVTLVLLVACAVVIFLSRRQGNSAQA